MPTSRTGRPSATVVGLVLLALSCTACGGSADNGEPTDTLGVPTAQRAIEQPIAVETNAEEAEPTTAPTERPSDTPVPATEAPPTVAPTEPPAPTSVPQPTAGPPTEAAASGCVSFNTAPFEELRRIINVDDQIAQHIIELRAARPFSGWEDLVERVNGIGKNNVKDIQAPGLGLLLTDWASVAVAVWLSRQPFTRRE